MQHYVGYNFISTKKKEKSTVQNNKVTWIEWNFFLKKII